MTVGSNSAAELQSLILRVENIEEQKAALAADLKAIYAEARLTGFDVRAMRRVLAERKLDLDERRERRDVFDTYAGNIDLYGDLV